MANENRSSDWDLLLEGKSAAPPPPNLISKLGGDLLFEILIRLPNPRSSCRCKAVCKQWRSLISDPSFDRRSILHQQSRYQPASLFLPAHDPESILSFLPVPDKSRPNLRALDCFKDLVLCGFYTGIVYDADGRVAGKVYNTELDRSYLVCNPFTKQWIALPLSPEKPLGYFGSVAGLVCQPRCSCSSSSSNYNLAQQLGDEAEAEPAFVYSEYRFRVVCVSQYCLSILVQVFCPESGKWTQRYLNQSVKNPWTNVVSWNGELFWMQVEFTFPSRAKLAAYNPFGLDVTPISTPVPCELLSALCGELGRANFAVSAGAFHIIVFEVEGVRGGSRNGLSVWRLEEDGGGPYWSQQYGMVLKTTQSSLWGDYELDKCSVVDLHPEKPEIVFFKYLDPPADCVFSCNLRTGTGEPEFFSAVRLDRYGPGWRALQPRVNCWTTPIPRYEELRGMYDGSYDCWVQNNSTATLPLTTEECQPLIEQSGPRRKDKRSAAAAALHSMPCSRRKQKVDVI